MYDKGFDDVFNYLDAYGQDDNMNTHLIKSVHVLYNVNEDCTGLQWDSFDCYANFAPDKIEDKPDIQVYPIQNADADEVVKFIEDRLQTEWELYMDIYLENYNVRKYS